jgi:hypothetical protein
MAAPMADREHYAMVNVFGSLISHLIVQGHACRGEMPPGAHGTDRESG